MRRYGLYDTTRGLTTAVAAGVAGLLLWAAALVGTGSTGSYWAALAIVAAAGLVLSLSQAVVGWTKGLRLRLSPGTFVLAFVPALICVGWILMATQSGNGWNESTVAGWSGDVGLMGLIRALALWHGALAFGLGLLLGFSFDAVPATRRDTVVVRQEQTAPHTVPVGPSGAASEPTTAEIDELERERTLHDGAGVAVHDRHP